MYKNVGRRWNSARGALGKWNDERVDHDESPGPTQSLMGTVQEEVKHIQHLSNEINIENVKRALQLGKHLCELKSIIPYGDWTQFVTDYVGLSLRTCQNHLFLNKHTIAKKYYILGTEEIIKRIRSGEDLSV